MHWVSFIIIIFFFESEILYIYSYSYLLNPLECKTKNKFPKVITSTRRHLTKIYSFIDIRTTLVSPCL